VKRRAATTRTSASQPKNAEAGKAASRRARDLSHAENVAEFHKQQKTFELKRTMIRGDQQQVLQVTCPQTTCGKWFIVGLYWARIAKPFHLRTRPCPHCFRTAKVPKLPPRIT
jgi:hypothetical protein